VSSTAALIIGAAIMLVGVFIGYMMGAASQQREDK